MNDYSEYSKYLGQPSTEVVEFLLREVPAHHTQVMRPYQTQSSTAIVDAVLNHDPSLPFNSAGIASAASSFLAISAVPEGQAFMTNGWDTKRFVFKLTTRTHTVLGTHTEVITGYSDYLGANQATQSIDPNMRFYVNQTTLLDFTATAMRVLGNNMVLTNTHAFDPSPNAPYAPQQRLNNMLPANIAAEISIKQWQSAPITFGDRVLGAAKLAPLSFNTQAGFVSELVSGLQNAFASPDYSSGSDMRNSYANSIHNYIAAPAMSESGFLTMLRQAYGSESSEFTMGDLRNMDAAVDHKTHISYMTDRQIHNYSQNTQAATGSDINTLFASTINNAIPGLMLANNLTQVKIRASNMTNDGQPFIEFSDPQGYAAYDLSGALGRLRQRLIMEVLNPLSHNNIVPYTISIQTMVFGNTTIQTMIGDATFFTEFAFPTFACNAYSPMLTTNISNIDQVVGGFNNLFDQMFNKFSAGVGNVNLTEDQFLNQQQSFGFQAPAQPQPSAQPVMQPAAVQPNLTQTYTMPTQGIQQPIQADPNAVSFGFL